eukprot:CAMPEP_0117440022 /NCGR_PEP_ID=MMETSP0759-20121206/2862_1 /TAXON_ID=63605 /ORGANISM="Percolomonas cosmopolitus, Strain WS" /LENGTH=902 /DNA_ID=CAMNT_0005231747 /DNA_START=475 /DNA_END=3180 /DNA_ORIENTATION=+
MKKRSTPTTNTDSKGTPNRKSTHSSSASKKRAMSALQHSAEKRVPSPKQPLMPAKLTLTINFGTKDNPKSRSKTRKPVTFSPRITSARRPSDQLPPSTLHNDALIKYDNRSPSKHMNGSARYASASRRHSNADANLNLNHSAGTWSTSARGPSPRRPNGAPSSNGAPPRHHSVDLTHAVPSSYKLAQELHNTQQSLNKQRPQSARPSQTAPSTPWHSQLSQQAKHTQSQSNISASPQPNAVPHPSAEPDYVNINYNYSFLKKPVSKMSPRYSRDMNRYKEDYKLLKTRLYGADELLMGVRHNSTFSKNKRPMSSSAAHRRASAPQQHNTIQDQDHVQSASQRNVQSSTELEHPHVHEQAQVHVPEQRESPTPQQRQHDKTYMQHEQSLGTEDTFHSQLDESSPTSPSFSFHMQALPPPKYFVSSAKHQTQQNQTSKRPKSAASTTRKKVIRVRDSRPASAAATSRRRSSATQYTDESEYHSHHRRSPSPHNSTPPGKEPMFGVFPPSRTISNQFFSRQRVAMNMKKIREKRENQRKLSQLLSTEGMPSPRDNRFIASHPPQEHTIPQAHQTPDSSPAPAPRVPSATERQQQDIIDYYDKKIGDSNESEAHQNGDPSPGVDDLPTSMREQLQKDSSAGLERVKKAPSKIQTSRSVSAAQRRSVLSPSAVSPVLFHASPTFSPGGANNVYDAPLSSFSPTSSSVTSPLNASFSSKGRESPQQRRSISVAERIKQYDWEGLQIGASNASSRFLSNTAPLVEHSPNMKRRPKSAATGSVSSSSGDLRIPRGDSNGENFSLLSTPSHLFEYRRRASDIASPIQIIRKELNSKSPRPDSASSLRQSSSNGRPTTARRPTSAVRRSGAKTNKKKAIKIKTPSSAPVNPERLDSPMTIPKEKEEANDGGQ